MLSEFYSHDSLAITTGPSGFWTKCVLHDIMTTFINMIIEDKHEIHIQVQDYRELLTLTDKIMKDEDA